ncbi:hypothetical protein LWI29_023043 [Acer saccharum]|uniref:Uncharacterized protein n=1 Tax=Acer saccharum TaxID=4024 RepID=A0AA39SS43_ACESA|nr:hypothetical protein LWI29_023043 [Acer saccharum]
MEKVESGESVLSLKRKRELVEEATENTAFSLHRHSNRNPRIGPGFNNRLEEPVQIIDEDEDEETEPESILTAEGGALDLPFKSRVIPDSVNYESLEIQNPSFVDSPIDSPINYPDTDVGTGTGVLPKHDQHASTIPSTSVGLSPSLPIPLPALVSMHPTINEMLARATKARGSSAQTLKQATTFPCYASTGGFSFHFSSSNCAVASAP